MSFKAGKTGNFGFWTINNSLNYFLDNDVIDGTIVDQDVKPIIEGNI